MREFLFSVPAQGSHKEYHQYHLNNEYIDDIQFSIVNLNTGTIFMGKFDIDTVTLTGFNTRNYFDSEIFFWERHLVGVRNESGDSKLNILPVC